MNERRQKQCDILKFIVFGKKLHKRSKNNLIPSRFGYVGKYVNYNECGNVFLKKYWKDRG